MKILDLDMDYFMEEIATGIAEGREERLAEEDKNYIFLPGEGYEVEEDKIYTLRISVHPALVTSKHHFRIQINQYLDKLTSCVKEYSRLNLS